MTNQVQERVEKLAAKGDPNEVRMSFGEHIEELRSRLVKSILFLILAIVVAMYYYSELVTFITHPHVQAMHFLKVPEAESKLMPGSYGGPIIAVMKLAFIVALFVSSPFIGYQMWSFVSAGLYKHEKRYVVMFAPISFALFTIGCGFGFFVLIPYCLIGLAKSMWRRSIKPGVAPQALTETAQRLERLESSVDAIAIEIERISEGQRFVTKLLSESQAAPALGAAK